MGSRDDLQSNSPGSGRGMRESGWDVGPQPGIKRERSSDAFGSSPDFDDKRRRLGVVASEGFRQVLHNTPSSASSSPRSPGGSYKRPYGEGSAPWSSRSHHNDRERHRDDRDRDIDRDRHRSSRFDSRERPPYLRDYERSRDRHERRYGRDRDRDRDRDVFADRDRRDYRDYRYGRDRGHRKDERYDSYRGSGSNMRGSGSRESLRSEEDDRGRRSSSYTPTNGLAHGDREEGELEEGEVAPQRPEVHIKREPSDAASARPPVDVQPPRPAPVDSHSVPSSHSAQQETLSHAARSDAPAHSEVKAATADAAERMQTAVPVAVKAEHAEDAPVEKPAAAPVDVTTDVEEVASTSASTSVEPATSLQATTAPAAPVEAEPEKADSACETAPATDADASSSKTVSVEPVKPTEKSESPVKQTADDAVVAVPAVEPVAAGGDEHANEQKAVETVAADAVLNAVAATVPKEEDVAMESTTEVVPAESETADADPDATAAVADVEMGESEPVAATEEASAEKTDVTVAHDSGVETVASGAQHADAGADGMNVESVIAADQQSPAQPADETLTASKAPEATAPEVTSASGASAAPAQPPAAVTADASAEAPVEETAASVAEPTKQAQAEVGAEASKQQPSTEQPAAPSTQAAPAPQANVTAPAPAPIASKTTVTAATAGTSKSETVAVKKEREPKPAKQVRPEKVDSAAAESEKASRTPSRTPSRTGSIPITDAAAAQVQLQAGYAQQLWNAHQFQQLVNSHMGMHPGMSMEGAAEVNRDSIVRDIEDLNVQITKLEMEIDQSKKKMKLMVFAKQQQQKRIKRQQQQQLLKQNVAGDAVSGIMSDDVLLQRLCDRTQQQKHKQQPKPAREQSSSPTGFLGKVSRFAYSAFAMLSENRQKAFQAQQTLLDEIPTPRVGRLGSRPRLEDFPLFVETQERLAKHRAQIAQHIAEKVVSKRDYERSLRDEYDTLHTKWLKKEKYRSRRRKPDDDADGSMMESTLGDLYYGRAGRGRRTVNVDRVRSEAELEQIVMQLSEEERRADRWKRTLAKAPPMITDPDDRYYSRYLDENGKVDDPMADYKERRRLECAKWTQDEIRIFKQKLSLFRKDFFAIAKYLPNKTTQDCVMFYFNNKHRMDLVKILNSRPVHGERRSIRGILTLGPQSTDVNAQNVALDDIATLTPAKPQGRQSRTSASAAAAALELDEGDAEAVAAAAAAANAGGAAAAQKESAPAEPRRQRSAIMSRPRNDPNRWSEDERELFIDLLKVHGRSFQAISNELKTKTVQQCKNYYHNYRRKLGLEKYLPSNVAKAKTRRRKPAAAAADSDSKKAKEEEAADEEEEEEAVDEADADDEDEDEDSDSDNEESEDNESENGDDDDDGDDDDEIPEDATDTADDDESADTKAEKASTPDATEEPPTPSEEVAPKSAAAAAAEESSETAAAAEAPQDEEMEPVPASKSDTEEADADADADDATMEEAADKESGDESAPPTRKTRSRSSSMGESGESPQDDAAAAGAAAGSDDDDDKDRRLKARAVWTENEKEMFKLLYMEHGRNWKAIKAALRTKTVVQLRTFYQNNRSMFADDLLDDRGPPQRNLRRRG